MLCPKRGMMESYVAPCDTTEAAIASAEGVLDTIGVAVDPELRTALVAMLGAQAASDEGDWAAAASQYERALAATPAALLAPSQLPLEPEPLDWASTRWDESLFSSELAVTDALDAKCADLALSQCVADAEAHSLQGVWEDANGASGTFKIEMRGDGRQFSGSLTSAADSSVREWRGTRKGKGGGRRPMRRGEKPSAQVEWVHKMHLAKARCHMKLGEADAAIQASRAATELCCRAANGWGLLAEAWAMAGDHSSEVEAAREEAEWLNGYA
jgi:hypothetical protein